MARPGASFPYIFKTSSLQLIRGYGPLFVPPRSKGVHMKGLLSKIKHLNSLQLVIVFCILYVLYFYAGIFVSICRWLHNH
jgi:hypothetical protein